MAELGVARAVKALASGPHPLPNVNVEAAIKWAETKMGIVFAESQRAAIRAAVTNKIMVVTGGPGTGKTTIVRAIIEMFLAKRLRVILTAPTGAQAAKPPCPNRPGCESADRPPACSASTPATASSSVYARRTRSTPTSSSLRRNINGRCRADEQVAPGGAASTRAWCSSGTWISSPSVGAGAVLTDLIDSKTAAGGAA